MKEEFTVITRGLNDAIADNEKLAKEVLAAYSRFKAGDWGDTCEEDKPLNDAAEDGSVIVKRGTTLMFCDEY